MKSTLISLIAGSALSGCAVNSAVADDSPGVVTSNEAAMSGPNPLAKPPGYASARIEENTYEVTYSGPWLGSRDAVEGRLLYRAAVLAKDHGSTWFRFLHLPGENGPLSHPSRPSPSFGSAYGHWQPHWSYRTEAGWQPWHPEWGDRFWADRIAKANIEGVEAHAMIELRTGTLTAGEQTDFEVAAVLRDLRGFQK